MEQVQTILLSLMHLIPGANIGHFSSIVGGIYSIGGGGVTQLNISRYCSISYRSVQRFMGSKIPWGNLLVETMKAHFSGKGGVCLLCVDNTVEDKAGKETFKLGHFFSSTAGKVIKSVSFGVLSLVNVKEEQSLILDFEQMEQDKAKTKANKAKKASKKEQGTKAPAGRPKGSKNKDKTEEAKQKEQSEALRVLDLMLTRTLPLLSSLLPAYLVADGEYGNLSCLLLAQSHNLFLVSKLKCTSVLYYPPKAGTKQRKFGDRVDFAKLEGHKIDSKEEDSCVFTFFQINKVRTTKIETWMNVVIIRCDCRKTKKTVYVILFSNDLALGGMDLVKYYSLRFQIEFNFRDAKQYFGLSDFKSIKPVQVTNAVGLSFFMVNLSKILIDHIKVEHLFEDVSILDIKAYFRAVFYAERLKKYPDLNAGNILKPQNIGLLADVGGIHSPKKVQQTKKAA